MASGSRRFVAVGALAALVAGASASILILRGGVPLTSQAAGVLTTMSGNTITNIRASAKSCVLSDGGLTSLGNNVPCVEASGLSVELAASNLFLFSQDFGNPDWDPEASAPPSNPVATSNTTDVLAPDGTSTAAKVVYQATTSSQFSRLGGTLASNPVAATTYTMSFYARGTGSQTFYMGIDGVSAGPNQGSSPLLLTTSWQRFSMQWTSTTGGSFIVAYIGSDTRAGHGNSTPMAAQTVYLWGAQFELGSTASSYIPTTTVAAARAADQMNAGPVTLNGTIYSLSGNFTPAFFNTANNGDLVNIETNSGEQITARLQTAAGNTLDCGFWNGSSSFDSTTVSSFTAGVSGHFSCSYDGANLKACINSQCVSTAKAFTRSVTTYANVLLLNDSSLTGLPVMPGHLNGFCASQGASTCY